MYEVLKRTDVLMYLSDEDQRVLSEMMWKIDRGRKNDGRELLACIVVEHDWPEFESTWAAISKRVTKEEKQKAF